MFVVVLIVVSICFILSHHVWFFLIWTLIFLKYDPKVKVLVCFRQLYRCDVCFCAFFILISGINDCHILTSKIFIIHFFIFYALYNFAVFSEFIFHASSSMFYTANSQQPEFISEQKYYLYSHKRKTTKVSFNRWVNKRCGKYIYIYVYIMKYYQTHRRWNCMLNEMN